MNNNDRICSAFKINGFKIINYIYARDYTIYYVSKDYAKKFNIDFNGNDAWNDGLWYEGWEGNYDLV